MLELRHVSKRFTAGLAVDDVSFAARPGEITGYLGPNGSGKSTTMKMITGLIEMTSGQILFGGKPIQDDPLGWKQRMGYVPEEPYLYAHLTGLEFLIMVGQLRDLPAARTNERETVERVCSRVVILHRGRVVADDSIAHLRTLMALPTLEDIFSQRGRVIPCVRSRSTSWLARAGSDRRRATCSRGPRRTCIRIGSHPAWARDAPCSRRR
jgi:ABC-type multidrug transport system ATPase subunit